MTGAPDQGRTASNPASPAQRGPLGRTATAGPGAAVEPFPKDG